MALFVDIEKQLGTFHLKVQFEAGNEVLGLLGASGCGKSMTLKCIAGIEIPDRGRIVLDGRTLFDSEKRINLPPQKRKVGYLFQQYALFPNMTVQQNIAAGLRSKENKDVVIKDIIQAMNLEGTEGKRPHQLSGGQQQRVALARILVNEPEVLLLDEPFSALDSHLRFKLEQEVRDVMRRFGKTVVLVSHNRDEVFRLSDRITILCDGMVETMGSKHEVFRTPRTKNGAILTGCKNISPFKQIGTRKVLALDWNMELELGSDVRDASYVGIRMHDLDTERQANRFCCRVVEEIENPFFYTLMLRKEGCHPCEVLGWEVDKEFWNANRAQVVEISLPPEKILLLKENKQ